MSDDLNRSIELHACRQHHIVLRYILDDIPSDEPFDAHETHMLLWRLRTVLVRHLALEDEKLYPALKAAQSDAISSLAEQYEREMGGLRDLFLKLCKRWDDPAKIAAFPKEFLREWIAVRDPLLKRMDAEDANLYQQAQAHFDDRLRGHNVS